jgi:RHS repeat-associated protein
MQNFPSKNTSVGMRSTSDYSGFGVQLDGRTSENEGYRYGFQGQERDDEVKGDGNSVNYKYRMHDPRIGRFFGIDPLTAKYPWNSPYAFSENRVIDGIDLEGAEFYYSASGTLLGKVGNSTEVRVVNADRIKARGGEANYSKAIQKIQNGLNSGYAKSTKHHAYLNSVSKSTGMNNDELMLRATLTTIRKAEGHGAMEVYNRDEIGTVFTSNKANDTDGSLSNDDGYNSHPGSNKFDASGAYQIQKGTWDTYTKANYDGLNQNSEFTPENQDKMALVLINEQKLYNPAKKDVFDNIYSGNTDKIWEQLKGTWVSLPGGSQEGIIKTQAEGFFKEAVKNELNGVTSIATPQGSLSVPQKK